MADAANPLAEGWAWLDSQSRRWRTTEVLVPVELEVGPVWDHQRRVGGWYAALVTDPNPSGDRLAECDHIHPDEGSAWACADELIRDLVADVLTSRGDS